MGFLKQFLADNAYREVDTQQVAEAISANSHTLVDVREQEEWDDGHIAEALHIPLGDLAMRVNELPVHKPVYTLCRSGARSLTAIDILEAAGHSGAMSMAGGMLAWQKAGRPAAR